MGLDQGLQLLVGFVELAGLEQNVREFHLRVRKFRVERHDLPEQVEHFILRRGDAPRQKHRLGIERIGAAEAVRRRGQFPAEHAVSLVAQMRGNAGIFRGWGSGGRPGLDGPRRPKDSGGQDPSGQGDAAQTSPRLPGSTLHARNW